MGRVTAEESAREVMDEKTTRKTLIDKALEAAGWSSIVRYVPGASYDTAAVEEYETGEGPADYVLFHRGEALAAVEAKKLGLGPQNVLVQAQRYARGFRGGPFNFHGFSLPFIYSTNARRSGFRTCENRKAAPARWRGSTPHQDSGNFSAVIPPPHVRGSGLMPLTIHSSTPTSAAQLRVSRRPCSQGSVGCWSPWPRARGKRLPPSG